MGPSRTVDISGVTNSSLSLESISYERGSVFILRSYGPPRASTDTNSRLAIGLRVSNSPQPVTMDHRPRRTRSQKPFIWKNASQLQTTYVRAKWGLRTAKRIRTDPIVAILTTKPLASPKHASLSPSLSTRHSIQGVAIVGSVLMA